MTIIIPDDILTVSGLSEQDALFEFACSLFDRGRLPLWPAARLAGLSRDEFEDELLNRGIPIYRLDVEDLNSDLEAIRSLRDNS